MGTTDNGYSAPPIEGVRPCGWDGAFAVPGVKDWDPVWEVFQYLLRNFDERVEFLRPGWCWGYAFRANANNPNALSRHSGAIAVDLNAPLHPNGVPTRNVFTSGQIETINDILDEIRCDCHGNRVLRWGGDYTGTPDAMHFEINVPQVCVTRAARVLKEAAVAMTDDDFAKISRMFSEKLQPVKDASVRQTQRIMGLLRANAEVNRANAKALRSLVKDKKDPESEEVRQRAEALEVAADKALKELDEMETHPAELDQDH